jgi:peptidylprolyl isomerase
MQTAQLGNTVTVHYCGKLDDGSVFDESTGREPLKFVLGSHQVIEGFENAVMGLKIDDKTTVVIPCAQAYGEIDDSLIFNMSKESFPAEVTLEIGEELMLSNPEGDQLFVTIKEVMDTEVMLDANHPLAGETLTFDIQLIGIE